MSRELEVLMALLPPPGASGSEYRRSDLSPAEILALTGRGLAVTGEVFDGVAHDFDRAKPVVRAVAFLGRLLVGLARVLTPGGLGGTVYRHALTVAILVDLLLFLLATLVPGGMRVALVATGYTLAAMVVVETARYVGQRREGIRNRAYSALAILVGITVLFVALYFTGDAILRGVLTRVPYVRLQPPPPTDVPGFWARFASDGGRLSSFAFGSAILLFVGLVWGRVVAGGWAQERGRVVARQVGYTVVPFAAVAIGAAVTAVALLNRNAETQAAWYRFAFFAVVVGLSLAAITFVESKLRGRSRRRALEGIVPEGSNGPPDGGAA